MSDKVRFNLMLTPKERDDFKDFCLDEKPRLDMTVVIKELMRLALTGKVNLDREKLAKSRK